MEEKELWKQIKEYPNYEVSSLGRIKSKKREVIRSNGRNYMIKEKILNQDISKGYCRVSFFVDGKIKHCLVHRLVAEAFIPNTNNLLEINHKDENKLNNCVNNLEWCTSKYNCNYGNRNTKIINKRKKPINQYNLDGGFIKTWESAEEIAKVFNKQNGSHINRCCKGVFKQMYGYIWRYANE